MFLRSEHWQFVAGVQTGKIPLLHLPIGVYGQITKLVLFAGEPQIPKLCPFALPVSEGGGLCGCGAKF